MSIVMSEDRYGYPMTRRYCRSVREAWPREHANPIESYRRPVRVMRIVCCVCAAVLIGALLALGV